LASDTEEGEMQVEIDKNLCSGHARCAAVAPELFTLDDIGFSVLVADDASVPAELEGLAERAASSCPERAILLRRD
jgi:ferredoxin